MTPAMAVDLIPFGFNLSHIQRLLRRYFFFSLAGKQSKCLLARFEK